MWRPSDVCIVCKDVFCQIIANDCAESLHGDMYSGKFYSYFLLVVIFGEHVLAIGDPSNRCRAIAYHCRLI
jgi:hypothetical protein